MKQVIIVLAVLLVISLLAVIPFVSFWAIAVLFGYTIQLTWTTGLAYWILVLFTCGGRVSTNG